MAARGPARTTQWSAQPRPDWSPFTTDRAHRRFLRAVDDGLGIVGVPHRATSDTAYAVSAADGRTLNLRLDQLAQQCLNVRPGRWPEIVAMRVGQLIAPDPLVEVGADTVALQRRLRTRILPGEGLMSLPEAPPSRPIAADLHEVVLVDAAPAAVAVSEDRLVAAGLDSESVFRAGRENLRRLEPVEVERQRLTEHAWVHVAEGDGHAVASWALLLDEIVEVEPSNGAVVGLPSRHALLALPMQHRSDLEAVEELVSVVLDLFHTSPGALTSDLLWWHNGALDLLPYRADSGRVRLVPPPALQARLDGLAD